MAFTRGKLSSCWPAGDGKNARRSPDSRLRQRKPRLLYRHSKACDDFCLPLQILDLIVTKLTLHIHHDILHLAFQPWTRTTHSMDPQVLLFALYVTSPDPKCGYAHTCPIDTALYLLRGDKNIAGVWDGEELSVNELQGQALQAGIVAGNLSFVLTVFGRQLGDVNAVAVPSLGWRRVAYHIMIVGQFVLENLQEPGDGPEAFRLQ